MLKESEQPKTWNKICNSVCDLGAMVGAEGQIIGPREGKLRDTFALILCRVGAIHSWLLNPPN